LPDGRLLWRIRLWEYDRVVVRIASTDALRTFARINRLPSIRTEIDRLVERASQDGCRAVG